MPTNYPMPMPTMAARPRASRTARHPRAARARLDEGSQRSISELDETHRRMRRNMRALEALLRLEADGTESADAETLLTEVESRLQAMALGLRSRCRAGDFDQIELAVYLRQATRLWNTPPGHPPLGGWSLLTGPSLLWRPDPDAKGPQETGEVRSSDLETILESISPRVREVVRRVVYSCAVTFPPWFFDWRSTDGGANPCPRPDSDLRMQVTAAPEGVKVSVSLSGVGPGLPSHFGAPQHRKLADGLASLLGHLVRTEGSEESQADVEFEVTIAGSGAALACSTAA